MTGPARKGVSMVRLPKEANRQIRTKKGKPKVVAAIKEPASAVTSVGADARSLHDFYPGYADYRCATQTAPASETGYEEVLRSIEQGIAAFTTQFPYIQGLEKRERKPLIRDWREYLQNLLETSRLLAKSIEESMSSNP